MSIKKAFKPVVELLQANASLLVEDVLEDVIAMCSAKTGSGGSKPSKFHKDEDGKVVAIFCYYFKKWFNVDEVEFGVKSNSPTGYNNMCKEGVSAWTAQQRAAKKAEGDLLASLASGELTVEDLPQAQADIEAARTAIKETDLVGYDTLEELLETL